MMTTLETSWGWSCAMLKFSWGWGPPANKFLYAGGPPVNKFLFAGGPLANRFLFVGGPPANNLFLINSKLVYCVKNLNGFLVPVYLNLDIEVCLSRTLYRERKCQTLALFSLC